VIARLLAVQQAAIADLSSATGLRRSTVAHTVAGLLRVGVLREQPGLGGTRGRPARTFSLTKQPGPIAVVVAAAHGTLCGVVTTDGTVLSQIEGSPLEGDAEERIGAPALELLDQALAAAGVSAEDLSLAVVGLPGPSLFPNVPSSADEETGPPQAQHLRRFQIWDGRPAAETVARHLRRPTVTENDANLAAAGEIASGAGSGMAVAMFISLAYGTSAGLMINGRLHRGRSRLAGEIGHLHAVDAGQLCACGARGCFWLTASIPALLEELAAAHHRRFTLADISAAAQRDQPDVVRALVGFGHALGRRLADAVIFLDPDAIILDGALGAAAGPIAQGIRESISQYAPPAMARRARIIIGSLGASAMLVGASALARSEELLSLS